jgi:hypothetical protein
MPTPNNPQSLQGQGPFVTLSNATTGATGVDFGEPVSTVEFEILASAGVSAGAITLEISEDNVNWFAPATASIVSLSAVTAANPYTLVASTNALFGIGPTGIAVRYARARISTTVVGGTVSTIISGY